MTTTQPAEPATPTKKTLKGTEYVVLVSSNDGGKWEICSDERATSPGAAIKAAIATNGADGMYVAVPTRSFQPVKVKTSTKTVVTLEAAE